MTEESKTPAVHPGQILLTQAMQPLGVSRNQLARDIDVPVGRISDIVNGKRGITTDTALRLAKYFGTSPDLWIKLQWEYDLHLARVTTWPDIAHRVRVFQAPEPQYEEPAAAEEMAYEAPYEEPIEQPVDEPAEEAYQEPTVVAPTFPEPEPASEIEPEESEAPALATEAADTQPDGTMDDPSDDRTTFDDAGADDNRVTALFPDLPPIPDRSDDDDNEAASEEMTVEYDDRTIPLPLHDRIDQSDEADRVAEPDIASDDTLESSPDETGDDPPPYSEVVDRPGNLTEYWPARRDPADFTPANEERGADAPVDDDTEADVAEDTSPVSEPEDSPVVASGTTTRPAPWPFPAPDPEDRIDDPTDEGSHAESLSDHSSDDAEYDEPQDLPDELPDPDEAHSAPRRRLFWRR